MKTNHLFTDEGGKKTKLRPVCAILASRDFISETSKKIGKNLISKIESHWVQYRQRRRAQIPRMASNFEFSTATQTGYAIR